MKVILLPSFSQGKFKDVDTGLSNRRDLQFTLDVSSSGKHRYSKEWAEDGVNNWKKGIDKIGEHEKSESHQICSEKLEFCGLEYLLTR